jgi:hypothetical protein
MAKIGMTEMKGMWNILASVLDIPPVSACIAKIGMTEMKGKCNVLASMLDIPPFSACISMLDKHKA